MDTTSDELVTLLQAGDLAELRRRYLTGRLAALQPVLGRPLYRELGARLDRNDTNGIWGLLIDGGIVPAPAWWGEEQARERRGAAAWIALLPLLIALAVVALALGRCSDDDGRASARASVTAATTTDAPAAGRVPGR